MVNCIEWQRWTWYKGTRSRDVLSWVWSGHTVNLINMFWITSEVLGVRYFLFLSFVEAASTLMTVGPLVGAVVLWACSCQPRTALPMSANYWLRNQEAHLTAGTYRILTVSFISWNITPNAESFDLTYFSDGSERMVGNVDGIYWKLQQRVRQCSVSADHLLPLYREE